MSHRHGEEYYKKGSSSSGGRDHRSHRSRSPLDEGSRGVRERSKDRSDSRRDGYDDRGRDRERDRHSRTRSRDKSREDSTRNRRRRYSDSTSDSSDEDKPQIASKSPDIPPPPPPPRISKVSMTLKPAAVQMKLGSFKMGNAKPTAPPTIVKPASGVASVFNQDSEDEEEEMPSEARMRMRNIGRETPTSAGPNSFGKTKQGFCDSKKIFEKNLRAAMEKD